jgi:hypothetical protein
MSDEKVALRFKDISEAMYKFNFPDVDLVIGIATGGIYPAILIAHQLKIDFDFLHIHFRDQDNRPVYDEPRILLNPVEKFANTKRILLVDEVSVSGKTMAKARELLKDHPVFTFVLKGKGDYVLFPDIRSCVIWPWKVNS